MRQSRGTRRVRAAGLPPPLRLRLCLLLLLACALLAGTGPVAARDAPSTYGEPAWRGGKHSEEPLGEWIWNKLTGHGHAAVHKWGDPLRREAASALGEHAPATHEYDLPGLIYCDAIAQDVEKCERVLRNFDEALGRRVADRLRLGHEAPAEHEEAPKGFLATAYGALRRAVGLARHDAPALKDSVVHGAERIGHGLAEDAQRVKEGVAEFGRRAAAKAGAGSAYVAEEASHLVDRARDRLEDLGDRALETAHKARERGLLSRLLGAALKPVRAIGSYVGSFLPTRPAPAPPRAREIEEAPRAILDSTIDRARRIPHEAKEGIRGLAGKLSEKGEEVKHAASEAIDETRDRLSHYGSFLSSLVGQRAGEQRLGHGKYRPNELAADKLESEVRRFCEGYLRDNPGEEEARQPA